MNLSMLGASPHTVKTALTSIKGSGAGAAGTTAGTTAGMTGAPATGGIAAMLYP